MGDNGLKMKKIMKIDLQLIMKEKLLKFKDFVEMLDKRVHKIK
jgi:hypothetical protein